MNKNRLRLLPAATVLLMTLPACAGAGLGTIGDVLGGVLGSIGGGGAQQGRVLVEVQGVDTRQQTIDVRTEQGERGSVMFDQNTVVIYRQQQYPVTALERGDLAAMDIQQVDQNRLYASRIEVQQSVQERTGQGVGGQLLQMSGRVTQIDHARGFFELQSQQGTYTVIVPANAVAATTDAFHRLRTGHNVAIEGTLTSNVRIDLHRFL